MGNRETQGRTAMMIYEVFSQDIPADMALKIAGLFAVSARTDEDHALVKAMLMQLAGMGIERSEVEQYPNLEALLVDFTGG
jgi:hypothetical protein